MYHDLFTQAAQKGARGSRADWFGPPTTVQPGELKAPELPVFGCLSDYYSLKKTFSTVVPRFTI